MEPPSPNCNFRGAISRWPGVGRARHVRYERWDCEFVHLSLAAARLLGRLK